VLLSFQCEPGTDLLEDLHRFVTAYTRLRYRATVSQRVSVAAYELFANALAYASVSTLVEFLLVESADWIEVEVRNEAIPSRIAHLREWIARLEGDTENVYLDQMRRSVSGTAKAALGLARIRHEAQMNLDFSFDGNRVHVRCSAPR
jgi:hypothetical protein